MNARDLEALTNDRLRARAHGCTELSCLYHGAFNIELMRRDDKDRA